jgi:hypothetical protein
MQVLMKQTDTIKTNPSVCKWVTRKCLVGENELTHDVVNSVLT